MEAVRAFNNELSSLYESKPPVSRAKMAQVTKFAIKAIKFYKHVVQSVEKFIQKCKPEYKVPGLYVIDSIVRQSRHQFGPEKDVFSPRFTKNIVTTFTHLFKCAVEERSRVVRVLNLWQKNCVFSMEIIQPLLDLAADPDNAELVSAAQTAVDSVVSSSQKVPLPGLPELPVAQPSSNGGEPNSSTQILQQTEMLSTITKLLKQAQEGTITNAAPETQLQQLQHLQQQLVMQTERISKPQQQPTPPIDSNLLAQIQMLTSQLLSKPGGGGAKVVENTSNQNSVEPLFNKKLLEFDYGDSDEDEEKDDHQQQHIHQHQQQRQPIEVPQQGMLKVVPDQNIFPKLVPDQNIFPKVVPDQDIFPKLPDQNIFPKLPDQNIFPKLPDQNIFPKFHDQDIFPKLPDQNIFPKFHDQDIFPKLPDQNIFPKFHDQDIFPKLPDQNIFPKLPDQNIFPKFHDQDIFPKLPDQNIFPKFHDQDIFPKLPDQNIFPKLPDQNIFPKFHDQNIFPKLPDQNIFPKLPDQNIFPKFHDQNIFPKLPDQNMFPKLPDQDIFPKLPDQDIFPKLPDQDIFPKLPDQDIFPKAAPDQNIFPKAAPDQNIFPKAAPDQNILPKSIPDQNIFPKLPDQNIFLKDVPDQNILPKEVPDQNILPKVVPDQNILQQIKQMSQQQEQLQSEIGAQDQLRRRLLEQQQQQFDREIEQESLVGRRPAQGFNQDKERRPDIDQDNRENHDRTGHRRQRDSRDRSPRRRSRRSRSRSRDRDRDRRRRSRSRDRHRRSRSRERERERREKDRERRKVGLPPFKANNVAICSTTIWFGRLTKHTTEEELREHIEKYGTIRTINMIPPRGCAFVCVTKRKDAFKVMDRLKGIKINGNTIKVAWAPGIGVKESVFKDLWDVDQGVTYIPWEQLPKDLIPLLAGGMVDEESLPEKLKGMKTGEEDEIPQQNNPSNESGAPHEESVQSQQPPPQVPLGMPGLPNFPLPGQNPMTMMVPGGPLSLLSGPPPPIGIRPGMGTPLGLGGTNNIGSPNTMLGHNSMGLSNSMSALGNMGNMNMNPLAGLIGPPPNMPGVRPNLPGMGPNLPGMRPNLSGMGPRPMNMHPPQGAMMGGHGNSMCGLGGPNMNTHSSPAGVNSPGPRGPFGHFGNMHRFPQMQGPGGMHSFVNNDIGGSRQSGMGDSDMRAMAEPKEWPPDDEVNAEDESDDDHPMDSDERMLPMGRQQHIPPPAMPNLQALGSPFGLHGPMLPGQGPPNSMLGIPGAPSPNTGMPSLISLRMMPPRQQPPVITISSGSAPGFALAPNRVRLSMPTVGVGQSLLPAATSPHLVPSSPGAPVTVAVSVSGSVVVTRPASNPPVSSGVGENPAASTEGPSSEEDKLAPHTPGLVSLMQIQGGNQTPVGPILGRGFAPMTIRPRGGPGLLGLRPGAHGGGGFNRFGSPRPLMGPVFGEMNRPPFGNRFGVPLRPPVGFLDQDEREDRDERRPLPRMDVDDHPSGDSVNDQSVPKDIDERRESGEGKSRSQDIDMRQDIDERPKSGRAAGRPSRWCSGGGQEETSKSPVAVLNEGKATDNASSGNITESSVVSTPSVVERLPAATVVQSVVGVTSAPVITKEDSVIPMVVDVSVTTKTSVLDGEGEAIQS